MSTCIAVFVISTGVVFRLSGAFYQLMPRPVASRFFAPDLIAGMLAIESVFSPPVVRVEGDRRKHAFTLIDLVVSN
tara:strand:- start:73 stop:300 length:228 start_codon:yes stop_codon:yes gene_type:complete